jgi:hypothetical protein
MNGFLKMYYDGRIFSLKKNPVVCSNTAGTRDHYVKIIQTERQLSHGLTHKQNIKM